MKKTLRPEEIIAILEAPLDLSWRRRKVWDADVTSDPARHFYPRKVRIKREATVRAVLEALRAAPTPRARSALIEILAWKRATTAIPTIAYYLNDRSIRVRSEAAEALLKIGKADDPVVGQAVLRRFDNPADTEIRATLALALGKVAYRPSIPSLIHALDDDNEQTCCCAAWALGDLNATEAIDAVRRAIAQDSLAAGRTTLMKALERIARTGESPAIPGQGTKEEWS